MASANIGDLTVTIGLDVDYQTIQTCLRLLEIYLNAHKNETLRINCSDYGNWDIDIANNSAKGVV